MLRSPLLTLLLLPSTLILAVAVPGVSAPPDAAAPSGAAAAPVASVRVASANLQEGNLTSYRADRRDATDRKTFARRLLARPGRLPDVVLLQEVLGTAKLVARALNQHRRVRNGDTRFTVATATRHGIATGDCDGPRGGRFSVLRGGAILVNSGTVEQVHERGSIRTWGRWSRKVRDVTGRQGLGCTEHPYVRATIRTPAGPRATLVVGAHVAPVGRTLKNQALRTLRRELDARLRDRPEALAVLGGDLNANRCQQPPRSGETLRCALRAGHRHLARHGYTDAVRSVHAEGPSGVVGVARRIDFIYTGGRATAAWYDRCYRAHFVERWHCGARRAVFGDQRAFTRCKDRSLRHGRPGGGCPRPSYQDYYSDHPVLVATVA